MMKINQLIKKINNTELGKTGTHETYVQVPGDWDVSTIFAVKETEIPFKDKDNKRKYRIRLTVGREQRICGLGEYYRDKALSAGDEVMFEKRVIADESDYYISVRKLKDTIVLRKSKKGFEVLTPERISLLKNGIIEKNSGKKIELLFKEASKKRADSQNLTEFYELLLDGRPIPSNYTNKDLIEIEVHNGLAIIKTDFIWKKMDFEV